MHLDEAKVMDKLERTLRCFVSKDSTDKFVLLPVSFVGTRVQVGSMPAALESYDTVSDVRFKKWAANFFSRVCRRCFTSDRRTRRSF